MLKVVGLGVLRTLGARWPGGAVALASGLARLTRGRGHGIAEAWLAAVFPGLPPDARPLVRQRTWEGFLKSEAADAGSSRGRYPRVVANPAPGALRPPLVLASFHVGPYSALAPVLAGLPGSVLALDRGEYRTPKGVTLRPGGEDRWQRAATVVEALAHLRAGGFVFVNVDGAHPEKFDVATIDVPLLGRTLPLARGAFALARVARVPIVPIVARWAGRDVAIEVGDPIDPAGDEEAMAAATAAWIDRYLRGRPGEVSGYLLDRLTPPLPDSSLR